MIIQNRRRVMGKKPEVPFEKQYLTFESLESGTFQFSNAVNYSLDGGRSWVALAAATDTPTLNAGDKILWKASLTPNSTSGIGTFTSSGKYNAFGNPLSLRLGDDFKGVTTMPNNTYMFYKLFYQNTYLVDAGDIQLVCTTLRNFCYSQMFYGCSLLIAVPELPAVTLQSSCYRAMFQDCTSLVTFPHTMSVNATSGQQQMYSMFEGCTSLVSAKNIGFSTTTNIQYYSCARMFANCTSLTTPPNELSVTACSYQGCYYQMFLNCTSLTYTPAIKMATYNNSTGTMCCEMFRGCTSLTTINMVHIDRACNSSHNSMFYGCTSLVTFPSGIITETTALNNSSSFDKMFTGCSNLVNINIPVLPDATGKSNCFQYMFLNCASITKAPVLTAATLPNNAYRQMFKGCSNLNYIKCLATNISATNSHENWVSGVSATGTFVRHPDMASWAINASGIPSGWTILEAVQITVTYTGDNSGTYLKEIGGSDIIHAFVDGEAYEADLDDAKSYGVYDSGDNLVETLTTPFNRTNSITI